MSSQDQLRALADHLQPELAAELERLLELDQVHHAETLPELREVRRQLHASTVMVGELRGHNATLQDRIAQLVPAEIVKARRDAYMLGAGFLRIRSEGGNRYSSEHIPAERVSVRDE